MVSTVSPKGDGKRQITHEASQLRHQTERIVVQKEGGVLDRQSVILLNPLPVPKAR